MIRAGDDNSRTIEDIYDDPARCAGFDIIWNWAGVAEWKLDTPATSSAWGDPWGAGRGR